MKIGTRLVVLPLPYWTNIRDNAITECTSGEITPIFKRDGLYADKHSKTAWIELKGKAFNYTHCYKHVIWDLTVYNHRPLTSKESSAIHLLIQSRIATKELKELYFLDNHWKELRDLGRNSRKLMLRIRYEHKKNR